MNSLPFHLRVFSFVFLCLFTNVLSAEDVKKPIAEKSVTKKTDKKDEKKNDWEEKMRQELKESGYSSQEIDRMIKTEMKKRRALKVDSQKSEKKEDGAKKKEISKPLPTEIKTLKDAFEAEKEKIEAKALNAVLKEKKTYLSYLNRELEKVRKKGDLDKVLEYKEMVKTLEEQAAFELDESYPNSKRYVNKIFTIRKAEFKSLIKLNEDYLEDVEKEMKKYTKKGNYELAKAFHGELKIFTAVAKEASSTYDTLLETGYYVSSTVKVKAKIYIGCDDVFEIFHNGKKLGEANDWNRVSVYDVELAQGDIIAIHASDAQSGKNTGGLYVSIVYERNGKKLSYGSDSTWTCTTTKPEEKDKWTTSRKKFKDIVKCGPSMVHEVHAKRHENVQKKYGEHLKGRYIWNDEGATQFWIKEVVNLAKFK